MSLVEPRRVFQPRIGVDLMDMTAFILCHTLQSRGWMPQTKARGTLCEPYRKGQPKVWWLAESQTAFRTKYMQAIMSSEKNAAASALADRGVLW